MRIWDFQRCYEEKVLRGHGADVKCVDWHPQKGDTLDTYIAQNNFTKS